MVAAAIVATTVDTPAAGRGRWARLVLLGAGMGVQNAVVRRLAIADLTTTVLTLAITGIASDSALAGGDNLRLTRRVASIVVMLGGAIAGARLESAGHRGRRRVCDRWGLDRHRNDLIATTARRSRSSRCREESQTPWSRSPSSKSDRCSSGS